MPRTGRNDKSLRRVPPEVLAEASWEHLRQRIHDHDGLDHDLRRRALIALGVLRSVLGETWPPGVYGRRNGVAECLSNYAPHAIASMTRIGEALGDLRPVNGWVKVVGRVGSSAENESSGAIAEILVAHRAWRLGFPLSFDPPTEGARHADVRVGQADDPATLYIEVCVKEPLPEIARSTEALKHSVIPMFDEPSLNLAKGGAFERAPEASEIGPLAQRVKAFMTDAAASQGIQTLSVPGLLELRAIRFDEPGYQEAVVARLVGDFRGIVFQHSPYSRLMSAVHSKAAQLPSSGAGLLVISPPSFLGQPPPIEQLVAALRAELTRMPHVVALALMWRQLRLPAEARREAVSESLLIQEVVHPPVVERVLFIPHPAVASTNEPLARACAIMCGGPTVAGA